MAVSKVMMTNTSDEAVDDATSTNTTCAMDKDKSLPQSGFRGILENVTN
jgi:hypothetical protein